MTGLILIIAVLCFGLMMFLFRKVLTKVSEIVRSSVLDRHKAAESILADRKVPSGWLVDWERIYKNRSFTTRFKGSDEERARAFALKRMDGLLNYFKTAPVFENDFVRKTLIEDLYAAREEWRSSAWQEMIPEER